MTGHFECFLSNLFTHEALRNSFERVREFYIELRLVGVGCLREGENGEKLLQQGKNQCRNLHFGFQSLADSLSWILDSKVQDSGFHKKNIQGISDSKGQIFRSAESGFPYMGRDIHF